MYFFPLLLELENEYLDWLIANFLPCFNVSPWYNFNTVSWWCKCGYTLTVSHVCIDTYVCLYHCRCWWQSGPCGAASSPDVHVHLHHWIQHVPVCPPPPSPPCSPYAAQCPELCGWFLHHPAQHPQQRSTGTCLSVSICCLLWVFRCLLLPVTCIMGDILSRLSGCIVQLEKVFQWNVGEGTFVIEMWLGVDGYMLFEGQGWNEGLNLWKNVLCMRYLLNG